MKTVATFFCVFLKNDRYTETPSVWISSIRYDYRQNTRFRKWNVDKYISTR